LEVLPSGIRNNTAQSQIIGCCLVYIWTNLRKLPGNLRQTSNANVI